MILRCPTVEKVGDRYRCAGEPPLHPVLLSESCDPDPSELGSLSPTRLGWGLLWGMGWMAKGGTEKKGLTAALPWACGSGALR